MIKTEKRQENIYLSIFVSAILLLFVLFSIALFQNSMGNQRNIFFAGLNDFFADFFNILRYIAERDPYFNTINGYGEKIWFPLAYLILYPFSQLDNFDAMTLEQTWASKIGIMSVFWFTAVSVFLFFLSLNKIRKRYAIPFYVFIGLCFSYIFVFSIERGNTIILSAAFVSIYLSYYDVDDKGKRMLAAICLALAAVFKIYPVLFGFLYFEKKQYRDIFFSAIVTLLLVFIPFVFFKRGFSNIPQLIDNMKIQSEAYDFIRVYPRFSLPHLAYYALTLLELDNKMVLLLSNVVYLLTILVSAFSILLSLLIKNKWIKTALLALVVMYLPVNSGWYCGLYLFPVIIYYFATLEERSNVFNGFVLFVFIILLNPFQFSMSYRNTQIGINYILGNIALLSLWLIVFITAAKEMVINKLKPGKIVGAINK